MRRRIPRLTHRHRVTRRLSVLAMLGLALAGAFGISFVAAQGGDFVPWSALTAGGGTGESTSSDRQLVSYFDATLVGETSSDSFTVKTGFLRGVRAAPGTFSAPIPEPTPTPSPTPEPTPIPTPTATPVIEATATSQPGAEPSPTPPAEAEPTATPAQTVEAGTETPEPTPTGVAVAQASPSAPVQVPTRPPRPVPTPGPSGIGCSLPSPGGAYPLEIGFALILGMPLLLGIIRRRR